MKCDPLSYRLFNKSMLVMYEFIECDFEDDFGFHKCLIHTYDMRHILNMNHVQCFNHIISPLIHFVLLDLFTKEENLSKMK